MSGQETRAVRLAVAVEAAMRGGSVLISEPEARRLAEESLNPPGGRDFGLRPGEVKETRRSWLFSIENHGDDVVIGAVPLVVDKASGAVRHLRVVQLEFLTNLTRLDRIVRWWHRWRTY